MTTRKGGAIGRLNTGEYLAEEVTGFASELQGGKAGRNRIRSPQKTRGLHFIRSQVQDRRFLRYFLRGGCHTGKQRTIAKVTSCFLNEYRLQDTEPI